jgi:anti-anti-sigma regulatory factor
MLKIQRASTNGVLLTLVGRIEIEDVAELQRLLDLEQAGDHIALDLRDVTLIDRDGVKFLARCAADDIRLTNCPAYIREWIDREEKHKSLKKTLDAKRQHTDAGETST